MSNTSENCRFSEASTSVRREQSSTRCQTSVDKSHVRLTSIDQLQIDFSKPIGEGGSGKVFIGTLKRGLNKGLCFAVKTVDLVGPESETALDEIKILKKIVWTPNLIRFYQEFQEIDRLIIVTEFAESGDLQHNLDKFGPFEEPCARQLMSQILQGVRELNRLMIFHGDLKPANILLRRDGSIAITDFGLSEKIRGCNFAREIGTVGYMAPEIAQHSKNVQMSRSFQEMLSAYYDRWADIFSLGVLFHSLLTGDCPSSHYMTTAAASEQTSELCFRKCHFQLSSQRDFQFWEVGKTIDDMTLVHSCCRQKKCHSVEQLLNRKVFSTLSNRNSYDLLKHRLN